ncbi:MAG: Mur ligase domain-containing protein, partial [Oligosphaeraceae bacterium]
METAPQQPNLPPPPARLFCVGIGGIGVSALAQLLVHLGYDVAGSDRGLGDASKAHLYGRLHRQGIRLHPQDGSGVCAERPDALIISNAVEPGNPDLTAAAPDTPVIHRARALAQALDRTGTRQIAIAGSCGKTSVTGWVAAAL